jgi:hypothetical protein
LAVREVERGFELEVARFGETGLRAAIVQK